MTVETAYQFLKPSLENFSEKERRALSKLIAGESTKPKRTKRIDPVPSEAEYRRKLISWFQSKK